MQGHGEPAMSHPFTAHIVGVSGLYETFTCEKIKIKRNAQDTIGSLCQIQVTGTHDLAGLKFRMNAFLEVCVYKH